MNLTQPLSEHFGVQTAGGVLVISVAENTPAANAGLRAGDVILAVDGKNVERQADLRSILKEKEGSITLTIMRDQARQQLQATLEPRDRSRSFDKQRRYQRRAGRHTRVL